MNDELSPEQLESVKKSYFNIVALFIQQEKIESRFLRCLLKWGFQLRLSPKDIKKITVEVSTISFYKPEQKIEKLESIYHLVYMIYLDAVVEDIELEVATIYAEKLGFNRDIVSELFRSIVTEVYDHASSRDVRQEVMDFLKIHEQ
jgi:hypothetical protein